MISRWITDERLHALWCANLIPYPLEKKGFDDLLQQAEERFGDSPFVATTDEGKAGVRESFVSRMNYGEDVIWLLRDKTVKFEVVG